MGWARDRGDWSSAGDRGRGKSGNKGKYESSKSSGYDGRAGDGGAKGKWGKGGGGKGGKGKGAGGGGGQKPTDDPNFVRWSEGMVFQGSEKGVEYKVEAYVASGTFSRVFRVREVPSASASSSKEEGATKRRWKSSADSAAAPSTDAPVYAAKVMRKNDAYIQYTSDACKEGGLLQRLEQSQHEAGREVLTMRCFDSFATKDDAGEEYWCLILEWLDASLWDAVRANSGRGLHLSVIRIMLKQLLEQLRVLQEYECTHTDIKHKNCCLANTEHFMVEAGSSGRPTLVFTEPLVKFIDYGNAVFEGERKIHPIHTKQFRAPEVLLNVSQGWGPPSDTWTLGVTAAFLVSGRLLFDSHDPQELVQLMADTLGPFPRALLESSKDGRLRRVAEAASASATSPSLASRLGLGDAKNPTSPEALCCDLLRGLLALDPDNRLSAADALAHPFVVKDIPAPARPEKAELRTTLRR